MGLACIHAILLEVRNRLTDSRMSSESKGHGHAQLIGGAVTLHRDCTLRLSRKGDGSGVSKNQDRARGLQGRPGDLTRADPGPATSTTAQCSGVADVVESRDGQDPQPEAPADPT